MVAQDIKIFCDSCLHCQSTIGGQRNPRPLGHTLHADKLNHLIYFDHLYMGPSKSGEAYILVIKDDGPSFKWLESTFATDMENTVDLLIT